MLDPDYRITAEARTLFNNKTFDGWLWECDICGASGWQQGKDWSHASALSHTASLNCKSRKA